MTIHVTPIPKLTEFATPSITIGAAAAAGSATTVIRSDSTIKGVGPVFLGTATASDSATLTVTGLSTTYNLYMVVGSRLRPATDGQPLQLRLGDTSGIDSGTSDYTFHTGASVSNSNSYGGSSGTQSRIQLGTAGVDNAAATTAGGVAYLGASVLALGSYTNVIITVEDSANNSSFATIGTFTAITAVPASQRLEISGTIRRYTRTLATFTGSGSSESITSAVGLARN